MLRAVRRHPPGHRDGILAYYDYPISTGPLEGINNKIQDHETPSLRLPRSASSSNSNLGPSNQIRSSRMNPKSCTSSEPRSGSSSPKKCARYGNFGVCNVSQRQKLGRRNRVDAAAAGGVRHPGEEPVACPTALTPPASCGIIRTWTGTGTEPLPWRIQMTRSLPKLALRPSWYRQCSELPSRLRRPTATGKRAKHFAPPCNRSWTGKSWPGRWSWSRPRTRSCAGSRRFRRHREQHPHGTDDPVLDRFTIQADHRRPADASCS